MRLKSELYKTQQFDIMNKIINILELDKDSFKADSTVIEFYNNINK